MSLMSGLPYSNGCMETDLYSCTRTGSMISEKTMEDGKVVNTNDDKINSSSLANLYGERPVRFTANGHENTGGTPSPLHEPYQSCRPNILPTQEEKIRKRINPLRIHLGKRPFVDNSQPHFNATKKRKTLVIKNSDNVTHTNVPRVPKLIPKRTDINQYRNVPQQAQRNIDNEQNKPVPRLVPKSQLLHYKNSKNEKGYQLKEYAQSLGLQPMVKFKCRKCCSMSFKTLAMLKEHQLVCRAQAKEPALSPEVASCPDANSSGPPRVTRKVYLCSACGTYYENWNLFLHMREVHNRHICLFCLGMFSKAEKLSSHLCNKHKVKAFNFNSKEEFFNVFNGTLYLMCCVCEEICSEQDDFFNHDCNNVKPKPVPVLISKHSRKPNNVKSITNSKDFSANGPISIAKELSKHYSDKREINDIKYDTPSHLLKISTTVIATDSGSRETSTSSEISTTTSKDTSNTVDSGMELEHLDNRPIYSPVKNHVVSPERTIHLPNGDDYMNHSEESSPSSPDHTDHIEEESVTKDEDKVCPLVTKEKECGIKLTLSLNSAKSPVIINSTVDPSVGQQNINKPPSRLRRPPKRYEKDISTDLNPVLPQPKAPSIKMTICDRADSPFVKTTIYENNKETTLKMMNNNLDYISTSTEAKQENTIKTTIYDNNLDEFNILNRVPKLTVRVPKELLDKDSSSDYSSDSDISEKLTVDEDNAVTNEQEKLKENVVVKTEAPELNLTLQEMEEEPMLPTLVPKENSDSLDPKIEPKIEPPEEGEEEYIKMEPIHEELSIPVTELSLDRPLDKYPLKDLLKVFLASTVHSCIYCNHVRKIAVNCEQLSLHMVSQHRFAATVDSITAEELLPETITAKLKSGAQELSSVYINLDSYDSVEKCETLPYDHLFECFQCYFKTAIHKDLYLHNRKMHQKTILLCVMCKSNFYSYSELLCHLCPGTYESELDIKFRCCLCNVDSIPSQFRLMVHLRKIHHTCDVCLESCQSQARLSNHVWKHKLHHLCYRCGIAYRNKPDITNHLFWKHGTESVLCKRCLQKKWPHVYHFCIPPAAFTCEECNLQFTRAVYLKVHKRFHSFDFPHVCTEDQCAEKFVSKKLLQKHVLEHRKTLITDLTEQRESPSKDTFQKSEETTPVIDSEPNKPQEEAGPSEVKTEEVGNTSKKLKKKKLKDKDALLLDVNLPALNLSESDSSDESDSGVPPTNTGNLDVKLEIEELEINESKSPGSKLLFEKEDFKTKENIEPINEVKQSEQQVLDIWDNFKKYQAKVEKQKEKTPPLVTIRKHVCESDHDYCLIPTDMNGDDDVFRTEKKTKSKKSPKKQRGGYSSSSSSSSESSSSCSCKSNCSCSSSSGSSSSSSSDSDSSDESGTEKKKTKKLKKMLPNRRISTGSNVDVMGNAETPVLVPEKVEPPVPESDLDTNESDTDEEFYDEHPQRTVDKSYEEKRNQLLMLASLAPSEAGSVSGETSTPSTPVPDEKSQDNKILAENTEEIKTQQEKSEEEKITIEERIANEERSNNEEKIINNEEKETKTKSTSSKKKTKKKKRSKSSRKHGPIKLNIPKEIITKAEVEPPPQLPPNKITISLQSNTVQIPEAPKLTPVNSNNNNNNPATSTENKRASKRRRVPNKFYGYSSDEEQPQSTLNALKPQQPPKLEWRKEDLPSPVVSKVKKEVPSTILTSRLFNYTDSIRLTAPIPDPEPPRILMNTESMESSDSDSSEEGNLEIYQPNIPASIPIPPPTYLNSGTSSLPYAFQRPAMREAREGESVYCYCRCPYDEVSEMIACDAEGCPIEWFHFECVGIMVPPKGKWYCPECRKNQNFPGYR